MRSKYALYNLIYKKATGGKKRRIISMKSKCYHSRLHRSIKTILHCRELHSARETIFSSRFVLSDVCTYIHIYTHIYMHAMRTHVDSSSVHLLARRPIKAATTTPRDISMCVYFLVHASL